jgi:prepilin-type N-terminal cleavage/methylation domain-containing protein
LGSSSSFNRQSAIGNLDSGFTLVEVTVVMALLALILAAVLTTLNTYQDAYTIQQATNVDQEEARRCIETIKGDLQETTFNYVFTDFWTGNTPRNTLYDFGYRQCTNASCPWIRKTVSPFDYLFPNRYLWALKWTADDTLCPRCGAGSSLTISNDALVLYSARENPDLNQQFMHLDEQGAPAWRSLIFYFPYYSSEPVPHPGGQTTYLGEAQLCRVQLYLSDIDPSPTKSFGDLLTFAEGTTHQHLYFIGGREPNTHRYWFSLYLHRLSSDGTKETRFEVRHGSSYSTNGYIYVKHPNVNDGAPKSYNFSRDPKVMGQHVVDVDFSTATSNSVAGSFIDATSLRITLATQSLPAVRGEVGSSRSHRRPLTTVLSTTLHPRN